MATATKTQLDQLMNAYYHAITEARKSQVGTPEFDYFYNLSDSALDIIRAYDNGEAYLESNVKFQTMRDAYRNTDI
jgi:hypothetical protein